MTMKRITPHMPDDAVAEMLDLPDARSLIGRLLSFFEEEQLTGSSNLVITLAEATVVGIGRVTNLELRVSGRYKQDGELFAVTDLGVVSISEIVRNAERVLDQHGK